MTTEVKERNAVVGGIEQSLAQEDYEGADHIVLRFGEKKYREGYKDAIRRLAIWEDGKQFVGVLKRPLEKVLEEIDNSPVPLILY